MQLTNIKIQGTRRKQFFLIYFQGNSRYTNYYNAVELSNLSTEKNAIRRHRQCHGQCIFLIDEYFFGLQLRTKTREPDVNIVFNRIEKHYTLSMLISNFWPP